MPALRGGIVGSLCLLALVGWTMALRPPPDFTVDLSLAPEQRWQGAVASIVALHGWQWSFGPAFAAHNASLFDRLSATQYALLADGVRRKSPDQALELQSIADEMTRLGHYTTFEYLCAWVWFHELDHTELASNASQPRACTALLVRSDRGDVLHARNMDQTPHSVRNITLSLTFTRGAQEQFRAVDWYWFTTGVVTAFKSGKFAAQENWRFARVSAQSVFDAVSALVEPQVWAFRSQFLDQSVTNFTVLVDRLCHSMVLAAPDYVAVSGPDSACVCARDQSKSVFVRSLNDSATHLNVLVQTNYDSCKGEPVDDARCQAAMATIESLPLSVATTQLGVYATVNSYPVHNVDSAYTVVMNVAQGLFVSFVDDALIPAE